MSQHWCMGELQNSKALSEMIKDLMAKKKISLRYDEAYKKVLQILNLMSGGEIKKTSKDIYFDSPEETIVKELIIELEKPFLQRLSKGKIGETFDEKDEAAVAFRNKMLKICEGIKDKGLSETWKEIIETLSRLQNLKNLTDIIKELTHESDKKIFVSPDAAYKKFVQLMEFGNVSRSELKDETGEFYFYPFEEQVIKALLIEMDQQPFLQRLTKGKIVGHTLEEDDEAAFAFRERMLKICEGIKDKEMLEVWHELIELLSRYKLRLQIRRTKQLLRNGIERMLDEKKPYDAQVESFYKLNGVLHALFNQYLAEK